MTKENMPATEGELEKAFTTAIATHEGYQSGLVRQQDDVAETLAFLRDTGEMTFDEAHERYEDLVAEIHALDDRRCMLVARSDLLRRLLFPQK